MPGRPPMANKLNRRGFMTGAASAAGALFLAACDQLDKASQGGFRKVLSSAEELTRTTQRFFLSPASMAKEFTEAELSPKFRANGSTNPDDPGYQAMAANGFADWKLK